MPVVCAGGVGGGTGGSSCVDENGSGTFDLGEEFWDIADTAYTNNGGTKVYNAGDANLDYNDPDERFFKAVLDTIRASTSVTDESGLPKTGFAVIKDVPKTLVSFVLEDANGGTRLTVTETGLAALPNAAEVFGENSSGWDTELAELKAFVEAA